MSSKTSEYSSTKTAALYVLNNLSQIQKFASPMNETMHFIQVDLIYGLKISTFSET